MKALKLSFLNGFSEQLIISMLKMPTRDRIEGIKIFHDAAVQSFLDLEDSNHCHTYN